MCHLIILIFQFSMFAFSQNYSNNDVFSISLNFLIFYSSKYTVFRPSNPFIRFSSCSLLFFIFLFFRLLLLVFHFASMVVRSFHLLLFTISFLCILLAFTIFFCCFVLFHFLHFIAIRKRRSQKFCVCSVLNVFHMQVF